MKIISHRGNLNGPNPLAENSMASINEAMRQGFDVEIDVWFCDNKWYLGHDEPLHEINFLFLENNKLWCHAKNLEALNLMLKNKQIHCFWHQSDDFTLTSKGYIWTYPNKRVSADSVIVLENNQNIPENCFGVCTDNPLLYKLKMNIY
jgi:glycerophosphoryl diester phosphodiesterase